LREQQALHLRLTLRQPLRGGGAGAPTGLSALERSLLPLERYRAAAPAAAGQQQVAVAWGGATPPPAAAAAPAVDSCVICLAEYAPDDELVALPCAHNFHSACGLKWLSQNPKCPLCNLDTRPILQEVLAAMAGEGGNGGGGFVPPAPAPPPASSLSAFGPPAEAAPMPGAPVLGAYWSPPPAPNAGAQVADWAAPPRRPVRWAFV